MRSMKRVLIGSFAAARSRASRAICCETPSISNRMRPGLMRHTHNSGVPLPLPMRTSIGFLDTGTSGKIRIQTRPARFICRVMARRAASIRRADTRSGSMALRPYWTKLSSVPALATPWIRPLWALRNLLRMGCSMGYASCCRHRLGGLATRATRIALGQAFVLSHGIVLHDLTLEDPYLDPTGSVGGKRGGDPIVDVGPQRVQRHASLAVPFHPRDLGPAQPS